MDLRPDAPEGDVIQGEFDIPGDFQPMDVADDFGTIGSQVSRNLLFCTPHLH